MLLMAFTTSTWIANLLSDDMPTKISFWHSLLLYSSDMGNDWGCSAGMFGQPSEVNSVHDWDNVGNCKTCYMLVCCAQFAKFTTATVHDRPPPPPNVFKHTCPLFFRINLGVYSHTIQTFPFGFFLVRRHCWGWQRTCDQLGAGRLNITHTHAHHFVVNMILRNTCIAHTNVQTIWMNEN